MLIRLTSSFGGNVYVNPEYVVCVYPPTAINKKGTNAVIELRDSHTLQVTEDIDTVANLINSERK